MRRRAPHEHVEEFWEEDVERQARPLREELAAWISTVAGRISTGRLTMPPGVRDRAAEIWRPLIAIADAAGEHWPDTARTACHHIVLATGPQLTSLGVRLLADLREVFTQAGTGRMRTTEILTALCELDEAPWADLHGKPLDARRLAKELDRYGVKPGPLRINGETAKGYQIEGEHGLADAWHRYLSPPPPNTGYLGYSGYAPGQAVTDPTPVTDLSVTPPLPVTDAAVTPDPPVTPLSSP